ncbi:helix-turn-helix transcriptional regulator [Rhodobacterales bacterium]|nr:helix-turn-helix transcriptional regulator [Rhodobacterales bacterium]
MLYLVMLSFPHKNNKYPIYLWEWRKHRGLTAVQLAERTGITQGILSALETGSRRANMDHLTTIAKILDVSVAQLFRSPEDPLNEIELAIVRLNEAKKKQAVKVLSAFLEPDSSEAGSG